MSEPVLALRDVERTFIQASEPLRVLRGFMFGLYSFSGFFFALSLTIETFGIAESFVVSLALAFAIQLLSLRLIRRRPQSA